MSDLNLPGEIEPKVKRHYTFKKKNWFNLKFLKNFTLPKLGPEAFKWWVISNGIVILFLIVLSIYLLNSESKERKNWYYNFFMISNSINTKPLLTVDERRKDFQLKSIGLMLMAQKDFKDPDKMTDKELTDLTALIFDKAPDFGIMDIYLPLAKMKVESGFNKNKRGNAGEKGLYQMTDSTARRACTLANVLYYDGIQFNCIDSTKIYLAYMRFLINRFDGDLNLVLLAYNLGEQKLIFESGITLESITNTIDIKTADISKVKKAEYGNDASYDEKVIFWDAQYKSLDYTDVNTNMNRINEILNGKNIKK